MPQHRMNIPSSPLMQGLVASELCGDQRVVKKLHLLKPFAEFRRNELVESFIDGIRLASGFS